MKPKNLGFEEIDLTVLSKLHKETQTTSAEGNSSIKSGKTPLYPQLKNIKTNDPIIIAAGKKCDKGSTTILKYSQVLRDPESPKSLIILRESITEEIHKHPSNYLSDDGTSSRHKYCREVIQPYLKDYQSDCPSAEILVQDALDSANEEFPDYQPCYEVYGGEKDIKEKKNLIHKSVSSRSSYSKLDVAISCKNSKTFTPVMDSKKCNDNLPKTDSSPKIPSCPSTEKTKIKSCKSFENVKIKKSVDSVHHKQEDNITKESSITSCVRKDKTPSETHNEAIITIKYAMEDFANKVYDKTKDVIAVIKTESARHLERFQNDGAKYCEIVKTECAKCLETCKTEGAKKLELIKTESAKQLEKCKTSWSSIGNSLQKKSSETSNTFSIFRKNESQKSDSADNDTVSKPIITSETLQDIVKKIDSKVSMITQKISENWPDALKPKSNYNDRSSPYDIPMKKCERPPKQVSHIIVPETVPTSSNVFSTIMSNVFALFSEPQKPVGNLSIKSSSSSLSSKKDDDDVNIDRLTE